MFIVRYMNDKFFFPKWRKLDLLSGLHKCARESKIACFYVWLYIYICTYGLTYWRDFYVAHHYLFIHNQSLCSQLKFYLAPKLLLPLLTLPCTWTNKKIRSFPSSPSFIPKLDLPRNFNDWAGWWWEWTQHTKIPSPQATCTSLSLLVHFKIL
jgi:hypothetical protein